ncbi:MAG: N-acetylmuramoyl-L-alanine amidase, partial [Desulfovibrio sp.]|nr:N-acetylmuramoyl-L-alanine amidase [Desulfovibrio sp.]
MAKNKREKTEATRAHPALLLRVLPSLIFAAALALLVVVFYDPGHTALPGAEKRYGQAKQSAAALRLNDKRAIPGEHWERLAAEFKGIYEDSPDWPNRPAALFRAAECLEDLARHSLALQDARRAADMYEELAEKHPRSRLADDALFRAARLRAAWLKDEKGALGIISVIKKRHAGGDMLPEAIALEKTLAASASGRTAPDARKVSAAEKREAAEDAAPSGQQGRPPPALRRNEPIRGQDASDSVKQDVSTARNIAPSSGSAPKDAPTRLTMLSWDSKSKDSVEITLALNGPASCTSRMLKSRDGGRMRLILDKVLAAREVEEGVSVRGSLLRGIRASRKNGATVLDIDFRRDVDIVTSQTPGRVVVRAEAVKKSAPSREERQSAQARPEPARPRMGRPDMKTRRIGGMADQLGLTVGTVFIDPGHGGRDPGAGGHNVLERRVALDVAQMLGRLLEAGGLEVVYSRTTDKTISLADRT